MCKKLSKGLERYLSQVDRYLKHLPASEKTDSLCELKSSFYERLNKGQSEEEILAEMDPPKVLAMNYLGESIVQNKRFSFSQFIKVFAFYSLASVAWISIIPTLAVSAVSFILAGGLSILGGVLGFIKGVVGNTFLKNITFMFFTHEISGVPALLAGLFLAIIFVVLGALCWKGTVRTVQYLQEQSWKLKHCNGEG